MRVNREEFLATLEAVSPGLANQSAGGSEQSDCFAFLKNTVCTYNDEVSCRAPCALIENGESIAVSAEPLLNVLRKRPEEELEIKVTPKTVQVSTRQRKSWVNREAEVLLGLRNVEKPGKWEPLPESFSEAVDQAWRCASRDASRFSPTCVHIHPEWIEACDDSQLCRWEMKTGVKNRFLVRYSSAKHIPVLGMTEWSVREGWVHFRNKSGIILSCRKYEEPYPELTPYFTKKMTTKVNLPKGLVEAIDTATIFTGEDKNLESVEINISEEGIRLRGEGVKGGHEEKGEIKYQGKPLTFRTDPKLLANLVAKHPECLIDSEQLRVVSGNYVYITCLFDPAQDQEEAEGDETEDE